MLRGYTNLRNFFGKGLADKKKILLLHRRNGRAVECGSLENC
ncbi:MAG: hypothetical protein K0S33_764 [Bacteroidetes bacterium]|nr:hypothetical protein [Bacteroidota bacterium]